MKLSFPFQLAPLYLLMINFIMKLLSYCHKSFESYLINMCADPSRPSKADRTNTSQHPHIQCGCDSSLPTKFYIWRQVPSRSRSYIDGRLFQFSRARLQNFKEADGCEWVERCCHFLSRLVTFGRGPSSSVPVLVLEWQQFFAFLSGEHADKLVNHAHFTWTTWMGLCSTFRTRRRKINLIC